MDYDLYLIYTYVQRTMVNLVEPHVLKHRPASLRGVNNLSALIVCEISKPDKTTGWVATQTRNGPDCM